jgi:hypothetical protein
MQLLLNNSWEKLPPLSLLIIPHNFKVGDFALVKFTREGRPPCYVPGVVYVVPLRQSKATKFYTVIRYDGSKVHTNVIINILHITINRDRYFSVRTEP